MIRIFIAVFFTIMQAAYAAGLYTNPARDDGFGAQFQSIIYSVVYAEQNNLKFVYTPFLCMEHNYDGDPSFLDRKEKLINFIGHFEINQDYSLQGTYHLCRDYFDAHMERCLGSAALKKVKEIFRENKSDPFDHSYMNVAVHVRRPNPHDSRQNGADTPDSVYLKAIEYIRMNYITKSPLFHIYSQGNRQMFGSIYRGRDIVLHIDEPLEDTIVGMVYADALVMSRSSLSYVAGMLSDGIVFYNPFWHPPFPHWEIIGK